jgi:fructose-bisphosphate aldolase class II
VLADGSIAEVKLDFKTLEELSKVAREEYGLAGAVQHGASTLPDEAFSNFPRVETAEIHLATNFQTMLYDHLPPNLRQEIYDWLRVNAKDERKPSDSEEQFFYKTRKKALGPFKERLWDLPPETKATLARAYDRKFEFLFTQLGIPGTAAAVRRYITAPQQLRPTPEGGEPVTAAAHDDAEAGE